MMILGTPLAWSITSVSKHVRGCDARPRRPSPPGALLCLVEWEAMVATMASCRASAASPTFASVPRRRLPRMEASGPEREIHDAEHRSRSRHESRARSICGGIERCGHAGHNQNLANLQENG